MAAADGGSRGLPFLGVQQTGAAPSAAVCEEVANNIEGVAGKRVSTYEASSFVYDCR